MFTETSQATRAGDGTVAAVSQLLDLCEQLPQLEYAPGQAVVSEGGRSGPIWIVVSGALEVRKGDVTVNTITRPGAVIGEMSVLLGTDHEATVVATEPTTVRYAEDGHALLDSDPRITRIVAAGLAERLNFVSTYLADLKGQYGDAPGLSMVSEVLSELSARDARTARPGSARDPDPPY